MRVRRKEEIGIGIRKRKKEEINDLSSLFCDFKYTEKKP